MKLNAEELQILETLRSLKDSGEDTTAIIKGLEKIDPAFANIVEKYFNEK